MLLGFSWICQGCVAFFISISSLIIQRIYKRTVCNITLLRSRVVDALISIHEEYLLFLMFQFPIENISTKNCYSTLSSHLPTTTYFSTQTSHMHIINIKYHGSTTSLDSENTLQFCMANCTAPLVVTRRNNIFVYKKITRLLATTVIVVSC